MGFDHPRCAARRTSASRLLRWDIKPENNIGQCRPIAPGKVRDRRFEVALNGGGHVGEPLPQADLVAEAVRLRRMPTLDSLEHLSVGAVHHRPDRRLERAPVPLGAGQQHIERPVDEGLNERMPSQTSTSGENVSRKNRSTGPYRVI